MGHRFSLIGRHNRARQLRSVLEFSFLVFLIKTAAIHNSQRFPLLRSINHFLTRFAPWQLIIGSLAGFRIYENLSVLLGLNAPHSSLSTEPDMHYCKNFSRCRVFLTALDAAVLSTLRVKFAPLRHLLSSWLMLYYLSHPHDADDKVNQFRNSLTVEHIRACWQKGYDHPILRLIDTFGRPHCKVDAEIVSLPRFTSVYDSFTNSSTPSLFTTDGEIECRLFYHRDRSFLASERRLILNFPGGGFVAMSPMTHADYLSQWAIKLQVPIISVNYRKAPEYPFPHGLSDCYQVYKQIIESNGRCVGINADLKTLSEKERNIPIRLALVGDSAGGNYVMAATLKALMSGVRIPDGVHVIYPTLDMDSEVWRSEQPTQEADKEAEPNSNSNPHSTTIRITDANSQTKITMKRLPLLSSRAIYAFDGVLPLKYQILLASLLFRDGGDPKNDILCSPVQAPQSLLKKFPPLFIHVGSVDPLCDDSIRFVEKLRMANPKQRVQLHIIPGLSHAYMQISKILPEGQQAVRLSSVWLAEILDLPSPLSDDEHTKLVQFTDHRTLKSFRRSGSAGQERAGKEKLTFVKSDRIIDQTIADISSPGKSISSSEVPANSLTVSSVGSDGSKRTETVSIYSPEAAQLISAALSSSPDDQRNRLEIVNDNQISSAQIQSKI